MIPADLFFGEGAPLLASAGHGTVARTLLDRFLPAFLLGARQVLAINDWVGRLAESAVTDSAIGHPIVGFLSDRSAGSRRRTSSTYYLHLPIPTPSSRGNVTAGAASALIPSPCPPASPACRGRRVGHDPYLPGALPGERDGPRPLEVGQCWPAVDIV